MTIDNESSALSWVMFVVSQVLTVVFIIWFVGTVMPQWAGGRLSRYIYSGR